MNITKRFGEIVMDNFLDGGDWAFDKLADNIPEIFLIRSLIGFALFVLLFVFSLIPLFVFYFIMFSEYFLSRNILRHKVKLSYLSPEIEEWLKETKNWKYLDYKIEHNWPLEGKNNEVRFLRKNDALKFKLVWG